MKQVLQNRKTGKTAVMDVPVPAAQHGRVLVRSVASLISAGTERVAVETVRKGLMQEARERPDLVRAVIDKARSQGLRQTFNSVRDKLAASQALGYSASGVVIEADPEVKGFSPGDRVACAGLGYASHAEVISVPQNLCVSLPENVSFEAGAFGTLGAIALQGVRLAEPTLGEYIVVMGLGLVGQLAVQLLVANGCRVFGVDLDPARVELARGLGADAGGQPDPEIKDFILDWTRGRGADAVVITTATESNQPVELAGEISRLKGRVIVVGTTGLEIPRQSYYARELSLKLSMSYGPGRYDSDYEERGHDYPFGYVRWTENRNIGAFLELVDQQRITVEPLISHRFEIDDAEQAYQLIAGDGHEPHLGVLLRYDPERPLARNVEISEARRPEQPAASVNVGVIGAGNYVRAMLLPHFQNEHANLVAIATASGVTAVDAAKKFGFARAVSGADEIIEDAAINLVVIGTHNNLHAELASKALGAGQHVFVEKPLALNEEELDEVVHAAAIAEGKLMVGFNRRFSPLAVKARDSFAGRRAPLSILYRVNAGRVSPQDWTQDEREGGGRIIGEVCHFIDLMQFWTNSIPVSVFAQAVSANRSDITNDDSVFITLSFADGSNGCIAYLAEGDKGLAKERVEIFCEGRTFVLDDFRGASIFRDDREEKIRAGAQDKGQSAQVRAVCEVVLKGSPAPIALESLSATTRATFAIRESLRTGRPVSVD
ncbi:MAG TPA: bi-domain-containing oxidoreductase [Pyrinomonadaceae bacterium]|nr:bi-domain-containing oxidoreductase [Pyrinomonadaceae bacterium]